MRHDMQLQLKLDSRPVPPATLTDYAEFVQDCAAGKTHGELVSPGTLRVAIYNALRNHHALDDVRKALYYGRPSSSVAILDVLNRNRAGPEEVYNENYRDLIHSILGMRTESDEVLELLLDTLTGREPSRERFIDELGDVIWFCQLLANYLGVSLEDVMAYNTTKLRKRRLALS